MFKIPKIWKDVWILGGGTSVNRLFGVPEDIVEGIGNNKLPYNSINPYLAYLKDKKVIGINNTYQLGTEIVDVLFFGDNMFYVWHRYTIKEFKALKCTTSNRFSKNSVAAKNNNIKYIPVDKDKTEGITTKENHLSWNLNSGGCAINLAYHLGATRIFLLGFDMKADRQGNTHWHKQHPQKQNEKVKSPYHMHLKGMDAILADSLALGIKIYNVTDDSNITQFEKITLEQAKEIAEC